MTIVQIGCVNGTVTRREQGAKIVRVSLIMATKDVCRTLSIGENKLTLDKVECFMDGCGELGE